MVLARLTLSPGTETPPILTELVVSNWLTSGATFKLITPSSKTVGVKARPTPNFRYSIPISPSPVGTGIGNSPPARKLAVSPDIETRLGSAKVRIIPSSSKASILTSRAALPIPPPNTALKAELGKIPPDPLTEKSPGLKTRSPVPREDKILMPNCLTASRLASTNLTSNIT